MRDFFVLINDDRDDLESVFDYEMGDFDVMTFWTGQPFKGSLPKSVRVSVDEGDRTDYMGNPMSWQIGSDRLWTTLEPLIGKHCQHMEMPLHYERNKKRVHGYLLLNPTTCIPAANEDDDFMVTEVVLDAKLIPPNVHIFRLAQSATVIVISDEVLKAVRDKKFEGLAFIPTKQLKA